MLVKLYCRFFVFDGLSCFNIMVSTTVIPTVYILCRISIVKMSVVDLVYVNVTTLTLTSGG